MPFHVRPETLAQALSALPALSILGVNLTVPHKEAALRLMDRLEPAAQAIGAVNTVTNDQGRLVGENSDAAGFVADLRARFPEADWEGRPALVLGAGGAARAVVFALRDAGVPGIRVANRTEPKARELVAALCPQAGAALDLSPAALAEATAEAGLIVNTTSLGLKGEPIPGLDLSRVSPQTAVYDLIYTPAETPLLREARARGLAAANGLGMLVRQGARSFEIWTGKKPTVEPIIQQLEQQFT